MLQLCSLMAGMLHVKIDGSDQDLHLRGISHGGVVNNVLRLAVLQAVTRCFRKALEMVRKARIDDIRAVQQILAYFAGQGKLLARSLSELYTHIRDMFVFVDAQSGRVIGCCSLHIIWENLAEIRSLAVLDSHCGMGVGRRLVNACTDEAKDLGISTIFVLTYETGFFGHLGFRVVDKNIFPHKIWADCIHCPKFPECDEIAMVFEITVGPGEDGQEARLENFTS